jgi:RHS repeat-associated protein
LAAFNYSSQPNGTDGVDTYIDNGSATSNYGTEVSLRIGEGNGSTNDLNRSLIKFDLSSIPANATITSATLSLWTSNDLSDNDRTIRVYRLKVPFVEGEATWNESASGVSWQSAGASGANDRESTDIGSVLVVANEASGTEKQISLNTTKIQEMVSGTFTNNGFIIIADTELNDRFNYKSSDSSTSSQRPKLVIQYTTSTPTPGPSPTPTASQTPAGPTATPTPGASNTPTAPPAFQSASFVYDGDGKRVKSTFNGTSTTYFAGTHFEVTGSTVTKYYYGGSQRIAMRTGGVLKFILGDHLGSTSLVTDANGENGIETRYKAWGEMRYASGPTPTDYTYTGQFSHVDDFGLMFYNARWYDPTLGRFAQADTIIPAGVQGYDRYAYTNNNPVRYIDPSGHSTECTWDSACTYGQRLSPEAVAKKYNVTFGGNWTEEHKWAVVHGVIRTAYRFAKELANGISGSEAFKNVYGLNDGDTFFFEWDENCWGCRKDPVGCDAGTTRGDACVSAFGYTNTENWIEFASMGDLQVNGAGFYGYPGNVTWEQSPGIDGSETFADQFLGWSYGRWAADPLGPVRADFMMQMNGANGWVSQAAALP